MSVQTGHHPVTPSAQVVGNAFVQQYYHILHTSPELVHRFYQDSSVLSRPDTGGEMTTVATMQGINDKILSLNFKDYSAEIETADAQRSYKDGVTVLVTGSLMGKDNLKRKFAQSFFLAPQDNGYFVLNDVFRFVEDSEPLENHTANGIDNNSAVPVIPDSEPSRVLDPSAPDPETLAVEQDKVSEKANKPVDSAEQLIYEKEIVLESQSHSNGNDVSTVVESGSSVTQEDTPKKSYASIVEKGSAGPTKVYIPTNTSRATPKKLQDKPVPAAPVTKHETSVPSSNESPTNGNPQEEVEGHSVYIRNLPHNMMPAQLEAEFKKYGPIKQGGIQVRFNKQQGYCFGFVEFESPSSMNNAVQASPISIGGRQAIIEAKRTSSRVGGGRGRFSSGRTGFRGDGFRGRGNYGGGRGSGRNEYGNRGEYGGQGRSSGRGEGYHQSRGRGGRSSGQKHITNST
ncbi:Nuclear transport factor 2 (NTF2) family protein with RNA binding (RRM-RBD-RNP motifs) domain [Euphorbia peplus]|nr:Nuclear transport factor 2 (NTF2) family protein with RNA binding (RRM-RBD-RNP motifs) domain [Euphorbia peplus]